MNYLHWITFFKLVYFSVNGADLQNITVFISNEFYFKTNKNEFYFKGTVYYANI